MSDTTRELFESAKATLPYVEPWKAKELNE